jgi:integrase
VIQKVEARGALDVAHRVLITAHGVWCHAVATGRAERDITPDIKKALKPHIKENLPAITDPARLAELLRASEAYNGGPIVRAALKLAPIVFQRPGNLRTMRWADLDLDAGLWTIPSEDMKRTKAQKINGQAHVVPLPRQAVAILQDLHKLTGNREWVFPGLRDWKTPMSEAGVSAALHAMGYKGIHTWHGYRATGRTILRQVLKFEKDVIEAQLAHKGQITHGGAYDRATHVEERTDMLQVWADYLDKLAKGADVIQFKAA